MPPVNSPATGGALAMPRAPASPRTWPGSLFASDDGLGFRLGLLLLSVGSVVPLWWVSHPPLQDLPQHLAAIHVLRSYLEHGGDPYFDLSLLRTQYLSYYALAVLLSYPLGIVVANKVLLSVAIVALPWSLASLQRALGRDARLCVFALGLTYNAHLILGFFNFISALPLMFYGLALAVRLRQDPSPTRRLALSAVLVLCFYTHVVPFAFLALGASLVLTYVRDLPGTLRHGLAFVPAGLAGLLWLRVTPAGVAALSSLGAGRADGGSFASVGQAFGELPMWLTDVLHGRRDDHLLVAWGALLLVAVALGARRIQASHVGDARGADLSFRVALLCPLAVVSYFVTPTSYDWIWPISARFPLIALLFAIPLLPPARGALGGAVLIGAALVAVLSFGEVGRAFAAFERREVGEVDAALDAIPAGERVAGLIFDRGSREVKFSPFIHYVALYQAAKGGAVMFTFADFPQSPFQFKRAGRPPRVAPRWEWTPDRVDPVRDLSWYRYVLVRGGPGKIARSPSEFENVFRGPRWSVWHRR